MTSKSYGPSRFKDVTWVKTKARARKNAAEALDAFSILPKSRHAGTPAGIERAKSIAAGDLQPAEEIYGWFQRHRGSIEKAENAGKDMYTSKAIFAAMLWGGWEMFEICRRKLDR